MIKQSDKHNFSEKYKTLTKLKAANCSRIENFGLSEMKRVADVYIPLEKFLQVINAFVSGGYIAYVKKSNMLKFNSEQYNTAINFIKNGSVTIDLMLDLYLLYKRAEQEKKKNSDNRSPIPYYLVDSFSKYECDNRKFEKISIELDNNEKINRLMRLYTAVTKGYCSAYLKKYDIDYNKMIKRPIDYDILDSTREMLITVL